MNVLQSDYSILSCDKPRQITGRFVATQELQILACYVTLPPFTLPSFLLSFLRSSLPFLLPSSLRGKTELNKIVMMRLLLVVVVCGISTDKHSINGSPIILMTELQFHSPVCYCVQVIQYWVWGGGVIGCQSALSCCLPAPAYSLWCTPSGGICPHCTNIYYYQLLSEQYH